jgi:hypothetical protein
MHVTDRPFKCHVCPATFKLEQHLKGHQKVHEDKPFECYVCEKRFRTYPNIRQHMVMFPYGFPSKIGLIFEGIQYLKIKKIYK